jgi:uncharacterized membrane-anchored protein
MKLVPRVVVSVLLGLSAAAETPAKITPEQIEAQLHYRQGEVMLEDGVAKLAIPAGFRYLDPADAKRVLVEGWGNPDHGKNLGMIVPADVSPLHAGGWGVVITIEEDGYVSDEGAEKIDYQKLLGEMQEAVRKQNEERTKNGYPAIDLVGWAEPPRYDRGQHKLYWAKELRFGAADDRDHTLNYNVRVLGRRGVLVLNAVAGMKSLPSIRKDMQSVMAFVEFNPGHRYSDYLPGKDKLAGYGLAALVAGTMAAKAGFFKVLLAGLLAFKKAVLAGLLAAGTGLKKLFGRKSPNNGEDVRPT